MEDMIRIRAQELAAGNSDSPHEVLAVVLQAMEDCGDDADRSEALLQQLLHSFSQGGNDAQPLLEELCMELLVRLAPLARLSTQNALLLSDLARLMAGSCTPREVVTAFLEVLGTFSREPDIDTLLLLGCLVDLLPSLLGKLPRRRVAFLHECIAPVVSVAQVQGSTMQRWVAGRAHAIGEQPADGRSSVGNDADAFLAQSWQRYSSFVEEVLAKVVAPEQDSEAQHKGQQDVASLVLQLLVALTLMLQPPQPTATPTGSSSFTASAALGEVRRLLQALMQCGVSSWQELEAVANGEAPDAALPLELGAALAATYSLILGNGLIQLPSEGPLEVVQAACRLAKPLMDVAAHTQSEPVLLKALQLLTVSSQYAASLPLPVPTPAAAAAPNTTAMEKQETPSEPTGLMDTLELLAHSVGTSGRESVRRHAQRAVDALLDALPPALRLQCLQSMLGSQPSEVCALLLQRLRRDVASGWQPGSRTPSAGSQVHLQPSLSSSALATASNWLRREGPHGWHTADGVAGNANAICAALNLLRLVLLRQKGTAAADANVGMTWRLAAGTMLPTPAELQSLAKGVELALQDMQSEASSEHCQQQQQQQQQQQHSQGQDSKSHVPGQADGSGDAVDAWLAVLRVQEVLGRVLELVENE